MSISKQTNKQTNKQKTTTKQTKNSTIFLKKKYRVIIKKQQQNKTKQNNSNKNPVFSISFIYVEGQENLYCRSMVDLNTSKDQD